MSPQNSFSCRRPTTMRHPAAILQSLWLLALAFVSVSANATIGDDHFHWNYMPHPYENFFLGDYCEVANGTHCGPDVHTVDVNPVGTGSAVVIRGFRKSQSIINESLKCCLRVRTQNPAKFNVQIDKVTLRAQRKLGGACENFVRVRGPNEEMNTICEHTSKRSMRSAYNEVTFEFAISADNPLEFQKVKIIARAAPDASAHSNQVCNAINKKYMCDNGACIWDGFQCDGQDNCGDMSDEIYCSFFALHWPLMAAFVIVASLFSTCCFVYQYYKNSSRGETFNLLLTGVPPMPNEHPHINQQPAYRPSYGVI